jgi:hypothetical protein
MFLCLLKQKHENGAILWHKNLQRQAVYTKPRLAYDTRLVSVSKDTKQKCVKHVTITSYMGRSLFFLLYLSPSRVKIIIFSHCIRNNR